MLDIEIKTSESKIFVSSDDWLEITSRGFNYPHNLFWIDGATILVANRCAKAPIIKISSKKPDNTSVEIIPVETIKCGRDGLQ